MAAGYGFDVAPVFARIEAGPMRITRTAHPDDVTLRFVESARAAGVAAAEDISGPDLDGVALSPVTVYNGRRWSTPRGYLTGQRNLSVVAKAQVNRIIIRNGRAVGVEYRRRGRMNRCSADHEVVFSAGAFGTPNCYSCRVSGPPSISARWG